MMLQGIVLIFFLVALSPIKCDSCKPALGCPVVTPKTDFQFEKYGAIFVDYRHTTDQKYDCLNGSTSYVEVNGQKLYVGPSTAFVNGSNGYTEVTEYGKCILDVCPEYFNAGYMVYIPNTDSIGYPNSMKVYVLATDYETYSIEYGCTIVSGIKTVYSGVYGLNGFNKPLEVKEVQEKMAELEKQGVEFVNGRSANCPAFDPSDPYN